MAQTVYVETSIISYLAARATNKPLARVRQEATRAWWESRRRLFEIVISQLVVDEASEGDATAVARRLEHLAGLPLLDVTPASIELAGAIQRLARLPARAAADTLHIALSTVHGVDFLMTWNLRHIANAELRPSIYAACRNAGFQPPIICTPDELMGT